MYGFLLFLHLVICLCLIGVVLIQSGKGGGLAGGAFGGSAQTVFGGRGATDFFSKATMALGAAFFISSLTLALMSSGTSSSSRSLIQGEAKRATQAPAGATPPAGTSAPGSAMPGTAPGSAPASPQTPAPAPAGGR